MTAVQRRLPWVVGRLIVVDRRRPRIPNGGNVLLVEAPIPVVEGTMWVVQGEASNVRRLLRIANLAHTDSSVTPLRLIGEFEGRARLAETYVNQFDRHNEWRNRGNNERFLPERESYVQSLISEVLQVFLGFMISFAFVLSVWFVMKMVK
jgi:hypothetical protein